MVQIEGTYELISQENFKEYLISVGLTEDQAIERSEVQEEIIVISSLGSDKVTMRFGSQTETFFFKREMELILFHTNLKVWTTATLNSDGFTFKTSFRQNGSIAEEKIIKITHNELTVIANNIKVVRSVRKYRRV